MTERHIAIFVPDCLISRKMKKLKKMMKMMMKMMMMKMRR
jgi:hypothetical protein